MQIFVFMNEISGQNVQNNVFLVFAYKLTTYQQV